MILNEQLTIAWCLQNPEGYWVLADRMGEDCFRREPWNKLWPIIFKAWQRHEVFPTREEIPNLLAPMEAEHATKAHYCRILQDLYTLDVTAHTGSEVQEWLAFQELERLGASLLDARSSKHDLAKQLEFAQERLEKVGLLVGKRSFGERYDPYSFENWYEDIEDSYGARPITTGFHRLDLKLRDCGLRPTICLVVGPTGGMKTTVALHMVHANMRVVRAHHRDGRKEKLGQRVVMFTSDDNKGDIKARCLSHVLQRHVRYEDCQPGRREEVATAACIRRNEHYFGEPVFCAIDPERYTPRDILRNLMELQHEFTFQDKRDIADGWLIEPKDIGRITAVVIDSGDHVKPPSYTRDEWKMEERKYEQLSVIPKKIFCPVICTVQSNQAGVGAAQGTERNTGGSYGKLKPAKLVLFVAQTLKQAQNPRTVDHLSEKFVQNGSNIWAYNKTGDRNTEWEAFDLCIVKNTIANGDAGNGLVRKVKIPCLAHLASSRIIEDYEKAEELMRAPVETQTEERIAAGEVPLPPKRSGKGGPK